MDRLRSSAPVARLGAKGHPEQLLLERPRLLDEIVAQPSADVSPVASRAAGLADSLAGGRSPRERRRLLARELA